MKISVFPTLAVFLIYYICIFIYYKYIFIYLFISVSIYHLSIYSTYLFCYSHYSWYKIVSHCDFNLLCPDKCLLTIHISSVMNFFLKKIHFIIIPYEVKNRQIIPRDHKTTKDHSIKNHVL